VPNTALTRCRVLRAAALPSSSRCWLHGGRADVTPALCLVLLNRRPPSRSTSSRSSRGSSGTTGAILSRVIRDPRRDRRRDRRPSSSQASGSGRSSGRRCFDFKERDFLMHWVPAEGTSHRDVQDHAGGQPRAPRHPGVRTSAPISGAPSAETSLRHQFNRKLDQRRFEG